MTSTASPASIRVTYGAQTTDVSYGRYPNGTGDWQSMTTPTPGAANVGGDE